MIKITKIEFINYRQYKHITVNFEENCINNIHILKAKNGTGKTTFLNGILWCLYSQELYLNEDLKALPLVNNSLVQESKNDDKLSVIIRMYISDNDKFIIFERTQDFYVKEDPLDKTKNTINGANKLVISITSKNDPTKNTNIIEKEEDVNGIVKQYFDKEIFDYYFFDGENLKNYFSYDKRKSDKIKKSIFNIAQVTLLKNAGSHTEIMANEKHRQSVKENDDGKQLIIELDDLREAVRKAEKENLENKEKIPNLEKRRKEIDTIFYEYEPIKKKNERRGRLEKEIDSFENQKLKFIFERNLFIREYLVLLKFFPRIKNTYEMILEKEKSGKLPPNIDKKMLKQILDEHSLNCPICSQAIDDKAISFISNLYERLDVSSETSNRLMLMKSSLEEFIEKCNNYPTEKKKFIIGEKYYNDEIDSRKQELSDINAYLSAFTTADKNEEKRIQELEKERDFINQEIKSLERKIIENESEIKFKKPYIEQKEKQLENIEKKIEMTKKLKLQIRILRELSSAYLDIQTEITDEIREEIQRITWELFDKMIWKTKTFGNLKISNEYKISVYNNDRNEMTGSLSATEYMALAYSFTLAIHKASGKNCPLVVDSPLGRVSDENRINMAKELLAISKEKQIIMLFTPDEYSTEVAELYDENAGSVRYILLSEDEKQIEKVGI